MANSIYDEYLKTTKVFQRIPWKDESEPKSPLYTRENLIVKRHQIVFDIFTLCEGDAAKFETVMAMLPSDIALWRTMTEARYRLTIPDEKLSHGLDNVYNGRSQSRNKI